MVYILIGLLVILAVLIGLKLYTAKKLKDIDGVAGVAKQKDIE